MSYYSDIAHKINSNLVVVRRDIEIFYANLLLGEDNWIFDNDSKGNQVILSLEDKLSVFTLLNRKNAIKAIEKASEHFDINFDCEIEYLKKISPVALRGELIAVLYDVQIKTHH